MQVTTFSELKKAAHKLHGRLEFQGMQISIENRKGSKRHWHDPHNGESGSTTMKHAYGYIRMTEGADGDHVDVYVGPNRHSRKVYVVNQMKKPDFKEFDEQKVMLGFDSAKDAKAAYLVHYNNDRFLGTMFVQDIDTFKEKVYATKDAKNKMVGKADRLFVGPRGGKWADAAHTIPWKPQSFKKQATADQMALMKRIRRRPEGEGAEIELNEQELHHILNGGKYALVSAGPNPRIDSHKDMTEDDKTRRHEKLRGELEERGYMHTGVVGHYEGREDTFLVMIHDANREDVRRLGEMFQQDTVIYSEDGKHELHYTHGENHKKNLCSEGKGWEVKPDAKDLFTHMKHPDGGSTKFALNINFKELGPCAKSMVKAVEMELPSQEQPDVRKLLDRAGVVYLGVKVQLYEDQPKTIQVTFADVNEAERFQGMASGPAVSADMGSRETQRGIRYEVVLSSRPEDKLVKSNKAPPPGYHPAPKSKRGGYRKRISAGRYDYWYPSTGAPERPDPTKPPAKRKGGPKTSVTAPGADRAPVFAESRAEMATNPGLAKLEGGVFPMARVRTYQSSADHRTIRSTRREIAVDDETKMQLINEYTPLIKSEAKRAMRLYAIKSWGGTRQEIERGGMEGLLNAIRVYRGGKPFSPVAQMYVRDYSRREAGREYQGGMDLPEIHVQNISRYIAARTQVHVRKAIESPTPEQVASNFELRLKHIHKLEGQIERSKKVVGVPKRPPKAPRTFEIHMEDGTVKTMDRNDLVPMQGYKLGLGRRGKLEVKVRGEGMREAKGMRDVKTQRSRVEWAQMYHDFLAGQSNLQRLDAGDVFNELAVGRSFSDEEATLIRVRISRALEKVKLGDTTIKVAKPGSRQKPAQYSVADLGDILKRRLGLGDYDTQSVRKISEEVPVYKMKGDDWVEASEATGRATLQRFIDLGMDRLKTATRRKGAGPEQIAVASVVDRAADLVAPQESIPLGQSYAEVIKEAASKVTARQATDWALSQGRKLHRAAKREGDPAKRGVILRRRRWVLRMSGNDARIEVAKGSDEVKRVQAEIRQQMGRTIDIERTSSREGIAHVYDPSTGMSKPMRVGLSYDRSLEPPTPAGSPLKKAFAHLSGAILREVQRWPELMKLLLSADESSASAKVERLAGVR